MYYINIMPRKSIDIENNYSEYVSRKHFTEKILDKKTISNKHICYFEKPKLEKDIIELYIYDSKKKIMNYNKK